MKMKIFVILGIVLCAFVLLFSTSCSAQSYADIANEYAPIYYFESQETCYPINASFQITYSYLYKVNENSVGDPTLISSSPTASLISSYSSSDYQYYYLDNQQGSPDSYDKIISDSKSWESNNGNTVYYHVYSDPATGTVVIQYWMYYAFNPADLNKHEGDWETVQIVLENGAPSWVAYSQHHSGQRATWSQVEKEGNHFKVYVARGSHANYLRSYSGKLGIANDYVGSNGRVLKNSDYSLKDLNDPDQSWVNFRGRWGESGGDKTKFASAEALGGNGPEGPQYREDGAMWNNPVSWGSGLPQADDMMFTLEWIVYNFVLIMVLITLASLCLVAFFIYRRHKKYGLGPRIVSMFYIDGLNLKSIGNILCIVGIIIAVIGLFNTWYVVSIDLSGISSIAGIQSSGMQDLLKIDGSSGVQVVIPGQGGPTPVGTASIPFSLFIGIALIFIIIATIGISHSKKLGWKYIWRGVRLLVPVILILIAIIAIGSFIPKNATPDSSANATMGDVLNSISSSPFGNQKTFYVSSQGVDVAIPMRWGLGLGAILLLIAAIIIIVAGVLEMVANTQFFTTKIPAGRAYSNMKIQSETQDKSSRKFCTECGAEIKEKTTFCTECGKKLK